MPNAVPPIEDYRAYLVARTRLQLAAWPWLAARLDASDVVHDAMVKAHVARAKFRGQSQGELVAWLQKILNRTLANNIRHATQEKRDIGAERSLEADLDASSRRLDAWLAADHASPSEGRKTTSAPPLWRPRSRPFRPTSVPSSF